MGRGPRDQAITEAQNLLYGRRHSAARINSQAALPEPTSFRGLNQQQSLNNLINLTASLGLSKPLGPSEQQRLCSEVSPSTIRGLVAIDIKHSVNNQLRLMVDTNGQGISIGAYYTHDLPGSITLEPGQALVNTDHSHIDELRDKLQELEIQRFGCYADPDQVLRRFDSGDLIELDGGRNLLDSKDKDDWLRLRGQAKLLINNAYDEEIIDRIEESRLTSLIDDLDPGDRVLANLIKDPTGRSVVQFRKGIYITEEF